MVAHHGLAFLAARVADAALAVGVSTTQWRP
jgi:hypothetical protein